MILSYNTQEKQWIYNSEKDYNMFIGKKALIYTQWDKKGDKINTNNYGVITDITSDYVMMRSGKYNNFNNLARHVCYGHENIEKIYMKIKKENIRKRVKEIDNNDIKNKNKLYIKLIKENFVTL